MNSDAHPQSWNVSAPAPDSAPGSGLDLEGQVRLAVFDPALHVAAVAAAEHVPGETPLMAAGWWSAVVAPEDPRALELRHIPGLPAADAARVRELFAEVVEVIDAGGACAGDAWEVLTLWELGSSPSAAAAANAVLILMCRGAEADEAAGHPAMPWWIKSTIPARIEKLLGG